MNQIQESQVTQERKTLVIPMDTTNDIQVAHVSFDAQLDVLCSMIEEHSRDFDGSVINSPIFKSYINLAAESKREFENLRVRMLFEALGEAADDVKDWDLDYQTGELHYTMLPANASGGVFAAKGVPIDIVTDTQKKHSVFDCTSCVMSNLAAMHSRDKIDTITTSLAFREFSKIHMQAKTDWENAKAAMIREIFTEEERSKITYWSLDYTTGVLKYRLGGR